MFKSTKLMLSALLTGMVLSANAGSILEIPATQKQPVIDGVISPGEWNNAVSFTGLQLTNDKGLAKEQTKFKFQWDQDYIYVLAECFDSNIKTLNKGKAYNDCIEIFFMAPGSADVVHWLFYSKGAADLNFVDSEFGGGYRGKRGDVASAVKIESQKWIVEGKIPATSFNLDNFSKRYDFKFNAHRAFNENLASKKDGRAPEYSSFSYIRGQFHKPLDFAILRLKDAKQAVIKIEIVKNNHFKLRVANDAEVWVRYFDGKKKRFTPKNGIVEFTYSSDCPGFKIIVLRSGETCFANTYHFFPKDVKKLAEQKATQRKIKGLGIGIADSMIRIFNSKPYCQADDQVKLTAARNEQENFQIVLFTGMNGIKNIKLQASDFIGPNGTILPASQIKLYREGYAIADEVGYPSVNGAGLYPDPLYPLNKTLNLKPESVQGVWVNLTVPTDAKPGDYTGNIVITADGQKAQTVKVNLQVWNFTIPVKQSFKTAFSIWERPLYRAFFQNTKKTPEEFIELIDDYAMMLVEHRLTPIILGTPSLLPKAYTDKIAPRYIKQADGSYKVEAEIFDKLNKKYLSLGATCFNVGPHLWPGSERRSKGLPVGWAGIWKAINNHYQANGMLKDAFAYPFDEPGNGKKGYVNEVTNVIRKNAPDLKILLTGSNAGLPSRVFHNIDIWVPASHWVNYRAKAEAQAAGQEVWWYPCSGPWYPYPNYHLDIEPGAWRVQPWASYKYGFDGILYWATCFYNRKNPLKNNSYSTNGEGVLMYSLPDGSPTPSIRLKVIADSMEDYEYLMLLKKAVANSKDDPSKKEAVKQAKNLLLLKGIVRYIDDYALTAGEYDNYRVRAAELIEKLSK